MNEKVDTRADLYPIRKGIDITPRLSMVLWGLYGAGKSTFAATAPGNKLWLSFGSEEHVDVAKRKEKDVEVIEMFHRGRDEIFRDGIGPNPYGLAGRLKDFDTLVVDSLSHIAQTGLEKAVADGIGKSNRFSPTMAEPGRSAFGGRNQHLLMLMKSLMQLTLKHNMHIIFTAHEDDPATKPDGTIEVIRIQLGGKLINLVSSSLSEVWNIRQEPGGKRNRIITTRPSGFRRPMKTRMFDQRGEAAFVLEYDANKPDSAPGQMTIASFYEQWIRTKSRIPVPNNRRGGDDKDNVETKATVKGE